MPEHYLPPKMTMEEAMPHVQTLASMLQALVDQRKEDRDEEKSFRADMRRAVDEIKQEAQRASQRIHAHDVNLATLTMKLETLEAKHLALAVDLAKTEERVHRELVELNNQFKQVRKQLEEAQSRVDQQKGGATVAIWFIRALWVIGSGAAGALLALWKV